MPDLALLAIALALGGSIGYLDSRPAWDDTGVTAGALLASAGLLGWLGPHRPWLWALAVGAWIPLWGLVSTQNYWSLLAPGIALLGAYGGMGLRKWI